MKKIIALVLSIFLVFASIPSFAYDIKYYQTVSNNDLNLPLDEKTTVADGSIAVEAEDMEFGDDAKIVEDESASGGKGLKPSGVNFTNDHTKILKPTMELKINVPESEYGNYTLWVRIKCINTSAYSYFESFRGYQGVTEGYASRFFSVNPDYFWQQVGSGAVRNNQFVYSIKYRDVGFILDKFVLTDDSSFVPSGKDDLPFSMSGVQTDGGLYPKPEITPPAGEHPRVLITKDKIPQLKENIKHPLLKNIYSQVAENANKILDCRLPSKKNNFPISLGFDVQSRAFMYLIGEVDKEHAKQTVRYMLDLYETMEWDRSVGDITRTIGTAVALSGIVYDWCYDVLTQEDKDKLIGYMLSTSALMEIGYPTTTRETFAGHGGEGDAFYFQLAAAIAIYDENQSMYNNVAGMLFEHAFETREYFNKSMNHPAGSAYGPTRYAWEALCQIVFDRMGYPGVMGNDFGKTSLRWIHDRLPNGFWSEDGDSYLYWSPESGPYYHSNDYPIMLYDAYFGNEYAQGEYIKQLSLKSYKAGKSLYDNGIITLLVFDPNMPYAYPDDEGKVRPLSYATKYPLTAVFARTSWRSGVNGETAVVFMNGQEKLVGDHDHDHSDIGHFSIYYKGTLTAQGGTYQGETGGWGNNHYFNYYRRSVSHNCITVYDPSEVYYVGYNKKTYANDGGQKIEKNSDFLPEFLEHPDEAKTEGLYIGPNEQTPEFTYLKTNLTGAYSEKLTNYTRSMVSLNLFNTDYPLAFIVWDDVSSTDPSFKKTWNIQAISEPQVKGNTTIIGRDQYDHSGKLVVKTLLPKSADLVKVGGAGKDSYVDGQNYPNADKAAMDNEQSQWRVEISPKRSAKDDKFLHAMYVTDSKKNLPELPMIQESMGSFEGVTVMDRTVLFSRNKNGVNTVFTLNVRDNGYEKMSVLVTDLEVGKWQIAGATETLVAEVTEETNALYAKLAPGTYTVSKVNDDTAVTPVESEFDSRTLRLGDYSIYQPTGADFMYNYEPTIIRDGVPYISETDLRAWDSNVTVSGNTITLTRGDNTLTMTIGSVNATKNGAPYTLGGAPFIADNGIVYVSVMNVVDLCKYNLVYDSLARLLKISEIRTLADLDKLGGLESLGVQIDSSKIITPVTFFSSSDDGNVADNLFDYNTTTRWSANGAGEFLVLDYGSVRDFDKFLMGFLEGDLRSTAFDILISTDGENYTKVHSYKSSGKTLNLEEFKADFSARYIKMIFYGNTLNTWNSVNEIITVKK